MFSIASVCGTFTLLSQSIEDLQVCCLSNFGILGEATLEAFTATIAGKVMFGWMKCQSLIRF
jgi:hypothetical protein